MIDCCPCYVVVVVSEANNPGDHKGAEPPYLAVYPRNARVIQLVNIIHGSAYSGGCARGGVQRILNPKAKDEKVVTPQ